MKMNRVHDLHHLFIEGTEMTKEIHQKYPIENDKKFNEIMDNILQVQQSTNDLLKQIVSKIRSKKK